MGVKEKVARSAFSSGEPAETLDKSLHFSYRRACPTADAKLVVL